MHEQHSDLPCSTSTPSQSLSSSILRDKIKKLEFQRCRRVTTIEKNENSFAEKEKSVYIKTPFLHFTHNTETKRDKRQTERRERKREFFSLELEQALYFETEHHKAHKVLQVESSHGRYFVLFVARNPSSHIFILLPPSQSILSPSPRLHHHRLSLFSPFLRRLYSFSPRLFPYSLAASRNPADGRATKMKIDDENDRERERERRRSLLSGAKCMRARASSKNVRASFCFSSISRSLSKIH